MTHTTGTCVVVGIGIDVITLTRIEREAARPGRGPFDDVMTAAELAACREARRPGLRYALIFAAKEACFKALGTGKAGGMAWKDIEIAMTAAGAASVTLRGETARVAAGQGVGQVLLSTARTHDHAVAWVVLCGRETAVARRARRGNSSP